MSANVHASRWTACLLTLIAVTAFNQDVRGDEGIRIGGAVVDITPVPGTPMLTPQIRPSIKLSEEAHNAISVRAVVIESAGKKVAIAACDVTSLPNHMMDSARATLVEKLGLSPDAIMISATHTHTAPQMRERLLGKVDPESKAKALDYINGFPSKIVQAVVEANENLKPASAFAGVGSESTISFNRRFVMKDGSVMTNPGKNDPALHDLIVRPAGPIDPDVGVVYFTSPDSVPLATMVNFALHLDTDGGAAPSADFAGTLHQILAATKGQQMVSLFAIGAAGNINHYDLLDPQNIRRVKGKEESARIGATLAAAVLKTYSHLAPLQGTELCYARTTVQIDLPREKGAMLAAQHNDAPKFYDGEVDVYNEQGRQYFDAEVQVISLGSDLAWVGLPGEMFTEFGLAIKNASPFRYTMIHELANRSIGYVPNMRAYPEGAYEGLATRCAAGSGEELVSAATKLLIQVKHSAHAPGVANH